MNTFGADCAITNAIYEQALRGLDLRNRAIVRAAWADEPRHRRPSSAQQPPSLPPLVLALCLLVLLALLGR